MIKVYEKAFIPTYESGDCDPDGMIIFRGLDLFWNKSFDLDFSLVFGEGRRSNIVLQHVEHDGKRFRNKLHYREGLSINCGNLIDRLDVLGYTLAACKILYKSHADQYCKATECDSSYLPQWEELKGRLRKIKRDKFEKNLTTMWRHQNGYPFFDYTREKFVSIQFKLLEWGPFGKSKSCNFEFLASIPTIVIIRILCEIGTQDETISWIPSDAIMSDFKEKQAHQRDKILIITEGVSDTKILQKSLKNLSPHLVDLFYFIDMQENYPFGGTGNLENFLRGLTKIRLANKTLIIFDNDKAGHDSKKRISTLDFPETMKIFMLPDISELREANCLPFKATSMERKNMNGAGVAIECFLNMWHHEEESVFHEKPNHQWVIEKKEELSKAYLSNQMPLKTTRLQFLWSEIIIAASRLPPADI